MEVTKFVVSGRDKAKLYGDYATYRKQLSSRIHNLRKKLGIATKPRAKYLSKAPVAAGDIGSNHEYVREIPALWVKYTVANVFKDTSIFCCSLQSGLGRMPCP